MKEIKAFFNNDNKLNKGYSKFQNIREPDVKFFKKQFKHLLPPIEVVEEFENLSPGTMGRLINMAENEQRHRHAIDLLNIEAQNKAIKMGQIAALISIVLLSMLISYIASYNNITKYISLTGLITLFAFVGYKMIRMKANMNKESSMPANIEKPNPRRNRSR